MKSANNKFGAVAEFRKHPARKVDAEDEQKRGPGRPAGKGKSSNPDYEQTTIFLPRQLKRKLQHSLLDDDNPARDLSDLIVAALEKHT